MHRIVVDVQTGEVTQVEFTEEEQAAYEAALAAQADADQLVPEVVVVNNDAAPAAEPQIE